MHRRRFLSLAALAPLAPARGAQAGELIPAAQIGTAHAHAAGKMQALRGLPEIYTVTGIAEPDEDLWRKNQRQPAYQGLRRLSVGDLLSSDVRVVAVETGISDAPGYALRCLEAGKHVHLDKPGALRHSDFRKFRQLAADKSLIVQMGYMLRYNPAFELLFRAVREGRLGEITSIDASMGKLAPPALRKELASYEGGGMFELACHLIDAVVALLGKPSAVHAFSTPVGDDGFRDNQLAVLVYQKATATLRCNHTDPFGGPHRRFQVTGTKGAMEISPLESGKIVLSLPEAHGGFAKGRHGHTLEMPGGRYDGEFADLAKSVRGDKEFAWSAAHDIAVHETVLKASGLPVE